MVTVWSPRPTARSVGAPIDGGRLLPLEPSFLLAELEAPAASEERTVLDVVELEFETLVPPSVILLHDWAVDVSTVIVEVSTVVTVDVSTVDLMHDDVSAVLNIVG
jgi:hypothetical protein